MGRGGLPRTLHRPPLPTLLRLLSLASCLQDTVASPVVHHARIVCQVYTQKPLRVQVALGLPPSLLQAHPHLHPSLPQQVFPFGPSATSVPMRHPPPVKPAPHGSIHSSRAPRQDKPPKISLSEGKNSHRITANRMLGTVPLEPNGVVIFLGECLPRGPRPAAIPSARGVAAHVLRVALGSSGRSLASLPAEEECLRRCEVQMAGGG